MGIEYCQNTVASQKFARDRVLEAEAQVRAQTKVFEALKVQLKEQAETLLRVTAFSLQSTAAFVTNTVCLVDVDAIRVNAWHAKNEKQAAKSRVFFDSEDKSAAALAAGPVGVAAADATCASMQRDWKAWEWSIGVQFKNFKANHSLGGRVAEVRKEEGEKASAAKRVGVVANRQFSPAAARGAAGKQKVRINGQVEVLIYQDLVSGSEQRVAPRPQPQQQKNLKKTHPQKTQAQKKAQ